MNPDLTLSSTPHIASASCLPQANSHSNESWSLRFQAPSASSLGSAAARPLAHGVCKAGTSVAHPLRLFSRDLCLHARHPPWWKDPSSLSTGQALVSAPDSHVTAQSPLTSLPQKLHFCGQSVSPTTHLKCECHLDNTSFVPSTSLHIVGAQ